MELWIKGIYMRLLRGDFTIKNLELINNNEGSIQLWIRSPSPNNNNLQQCINRINKNGTLD